MDGTSPSLPPTTPSSLEDFPATTYLSTEDVLRNMARPIALVGNGPVAQPYGSLIDDHATVIRCNNFELRGHESQVGSKVTHWCINGFVERTRTRAPWGVWLTKAVSWWRPAGLRPNPYVNEQTTCFCPRAFDWVLVDNCRRFLGVTPSCVGDATLLYPLQAVVPYPTIGFAALYLLLRFQPEVSVFGFGGLAGGHYWNRAHRHSRRHLPTARLELELIQATPRVRVYR